MLPHKTASSTLHPITNLRQTSGARCKVLHAPAHTPLQHSVHTFTPPHPLHTCRPSSSTSQAARLALLRPSSASIASIWAACCFTSTRTCRWGGEAGARTGALYKGRRLGPQPRVASLQPAPVGGRRSGGQKQRRGAGLSGNARGNGTNSHAQWGGGGRFYPTHSKVLPFPSPTHPAR